MERDREATRVQGRNRTGTAHDRSKVPIAKKGKRSHHRPEKWAESAEEFGAGGRRVNAKKKKTHRNNRCQGRGEGGKGIEDNNMGMKVRSRPLSE